MPQDARATETRAADAQHTLNQARRCRMLSVVAGLLVSTAAAAADNGDWPQFGRTPRHLNVNPTEHSFTPSNIINLRVAWKGHFGNNASTEGGAVIANGMAYVAGFDGMLSAFALDGCGAESCEPLWQGRTANDISSTPAVAGGLVLVGSADRFLYAFAASGCGLRTCHPVWKGRLRDGVLESSVAVAGGVAYVGDFGGRLYAFAANGCGRPVCNPLWTGQAGPNEHLLSSPAVGQGSVFIGSSSFTPRDFTGRLLVFPAQGCGQPTCKPTWTANIGGPMGRTGSALVAGDTVYIGSTRRFGGPNGRDHLFAFAARGCGTRVCRPLRSYDVGPDGTDTTPALANGILFATTQVSPSPNRVGVVAAFRANGCGLARCPPVWTGVSSTFGFNSSPVVTGGIVFVGQGPASGINIDSGVFSFRASGCGAIVCEALSLTLAGPDQGYLSAPLAVAHGRIGFVSNDNADGHSNLYMMSLPATP
jgi:outer membrane protein assembly factor BamB